MRKKHIGNDGHYVYVYKDLKGKVRYVGYCKGLGRAISRSRSEPMVDFLAGKYTLEIAGPYGSRETGLAVETALISILRPDLNSSRAPGLGRFRFRPLGVPEAFAERLSLPALTATELTRISKAKACPILFVRISDQDFLGEDARRGYSLDKLLSDSEILKRMVQWWQIGRFVTTWARFQGKSPRTLVAVTGTPSHRIIIGAVHVDRRGWSAVKPEHGGLYKVPTIETRRLDAHGLRGRLLSSHINVKFGAFRSQFYVILNEAGKVIGGQK